MKQRLFALLHYAGVFRFFAWLNRRTPSIVAYHSVIDGCDPLESDPHQLHIPLALFRKHLDYLKKNHNVISLGDFLEAKRSGNPLPHYSVVLTFEDGFRDFHSIAARELLLRSLPATIFVITDFANGFHTPHEDSFLSWHEVRHLVKMGFEVGSHTRSHLNLTQIPFEDAADQLSESLAAIREHMGQKEVPLSYPYGCTSEEISRLAETVGYCCAIGDVIEDVKPANDLFCLARLTIASNDGLAALAARVSGFTSWVHHLNGTPRMLKPFDEISRLAPAESDPCAGGQIISS